MTTTLTPVECGECTEGIVTIRGSCDCGWCDSTEHPCTVCDSTGQRGCDYCGERPAFDHDGPVLCEGCAKEEAA